MTQIPESLAVLAEALCPLSHSLAAGLLIRPITDQGLPETSTQAVVLCNELSNTLAECVPAMRQAMAGLEDSDQDESEELVDELATAALEIVDMARRIWQSPLPPEAEGLRPLLATLAEAPVTQLLQWVLEIMQLAIDPWSIAEDPANPAVSFTLHVPDAPLREAINAWSSHNPGILPAAFRF